MASKETLVIDDGDLFLPLLIAGVASLLLTYLFLNQVIMVGFDGISK